MKGKPIEIDLGRATTGVVTDEGDPAFVEVNIRGGTLTLELRGDNRRKWAGARAAKRSIELVLRLTLEPDEKAARRKDKWSDLQPSTQAELVKAAAMEVQRQHPYRGQRLATTTFGDKVFITAVWAEVHKTYDGTLDQFKTSLVELHRARKVSLSRADLVQAMDPAVVEASETSYLNARWHFVRVE